MSIKNLFGKSVSNYEEVAKDVESTEFIEEVVAKRETYLPPIDFSDPANFVYYGSAELYYEAAIKRIYEDYPYDGSKAEQIEFEERSSYLERWLFENKYPKTTGHIQLGTTADPAGKSGTYRLTNTPEYIRVWGGLHTGSASDGLDYQLSNSAKYDEATNRNQNWNCDFEKGVTIEFWMKKDSTTFAESEVILDLWNQSSTPTNSRMIIQFEYFGTPQISLTIVKDAASQAYLFNIPDFSVSTWFHLSISIIKEDGALKIRFYKNGEEVQNTTFSSAYEFEGRMDAFIGALQTSSFGFGATGAGKLSAYLDEFRFWKTRRTDRQIKLNWFREIGGGANTDDATSDLGVYLKFNEGITENNNIDSIVLDYSGRLANGTWEGYPGSSARSTESAMVVSGFTEKPSPIIYSSHPDVLALEAEMTLSGSEYDSRRGQALYHSLPNWLVEQDQDIGEENLRKISHILSSYMDTLRVQIDSLNKLQDKKYVSSEFKAAPFASELLKNKGFITSEMFLDAEIFEAFSEINYDHGQYDINIDEIKNLIFTNIYNNLENIYNSKGTEKSIRNLIRCFGIDDELIKLNQYTDLGTQYLGDKYRTTSVKKKYINFNNPDHFIATMYQDGAQTYVSGATEASSSAFTMEADILVPYKKKRSEDGYFNTPFLSASIMGFHEANPTNPSDFSWFTSGTEARDLQVYLVRDSLNSDHAKFLIKNETETIYATSSYIYDIYNDEHYNVALRIKPQTYPYAANVTNTTPDYDIELYAVSHNFDEIKEEHLISVTVDHATGSQYMQVPKRIYAGAHWLYFNISLLQRTDLEFGRISAWLDYLPNSSIQEHNKDVLNHGNFKSIDGSTAFSIGDKKIPSMELSILNWDFDTVTTSDAAGEFVIQDTTSGSADTIYGWVDNIIRREHEGKGEYFPELSTAFLENEFLYAYKKQLPETSFNVNNIFIKGEQEINFAEDDDVSDNLFVLEKSPSSIVSEEMLKLFSTTQEFSNLFGRNIDKYRIEYKDLAKARELFYNKSIDGIDFDKFFEYFKWIDSSLSRMIEQIIPASVNYFGGIVDVIEPHILERDKYQRQVGLLQTVTSTEASIRGVQELNYNYRIGRAPLPLDNSTNSLWQKERRERDYGVADNELETIRQVLVRQNDQEFTNPVVLSGSTQLISGSYAARRFSRPYSLNVGFNNSIHSGINYTKGKNRDFLRSAIGLHSPIGASGAPKNVVTFGAGSGNDLNFEEIHKDIDTRGPNDLIKLDGFGLVGKYTDFIGTNHPPLSPDQDYMSRLKTSDIFIGNIVSSSVTGGYNAIINKPLGSGGYRKDVEVVNLHSDTVDITNEIPIQGPFTEAHIGGHQHRHVALNSVGKPERFSQPQFNGLDHNFSRPEGWRLLIGQNPLTVNLKDGITSNDTPSNDDGALGFTAPDYGISQAGTFPDTDRLYAIYYREERAKRPVNIKNIQTLTSSATHGNYQHEYEVFSTVGDQGYFLKRAGNLLPDAIASELPETTNYITLASQNPFPYGNTFGANSNRYSDTGKIILSPEILGQTATGGTFSVSGSDFVTDGESISILEDSGLNIYYINTGGMVGDIVPTGSSDSEFFLNFQTTVQSNMTNFAVSKTEYLNNTYGISFSDRPSNEGLGTFTSVSFDGVEPFTISFYTLFDTTLGSLRFIYSETNSTGVGRQLYIDGAGTLRFKINYVDNSATSRVDEYYLNGFLQIYGGALQHVVVTKGSSFGSTGGSDADLYINGSPVAWSGTSLPAASLPATINAVDSFFIACEKPNLYSTTGFSVNGQTCYLDEVMILNKKVNIDEANELYNSGFRWDLSNPPVISINYNTDIESIYTFENPLDGFGDGDRINDEKANNALIVTDPSSKIQQADLGILSAIPYCDFVITPNDTGSYGNFTISSTSGDFFNLTNSTGGVNYQAEISLQGIDNIVETQDRSTGSAHVIRTRFSAPGGPEVNSSGYLDIATQQYSVHNSMNYRNLTVRASGSGEIGTIRVNSHSDHREGLRTLRTRHQGKFGIDSQWGAVSSTDYVAEASWHKQHRNAGKVAYNIEDEWGDTVVEVRNRYDNDHYHRPLPASDFQYSWINSAISGSNWENNQIILTYAPRNGLISSSVGITEAIIFPSASSFYGE